jgi:predicted DNA-binding protein
MKRTTIFMEEHVESDLHAVARRQGRPVAAVVREALGRYVAQEKGKSDLSLSFLAVGRSGHTDTAETHEAWLWSDLETGVDRGRKSTARQRDATKQARQKTGRGTGLAQPARPGKRRR